MSESFVYFVSFKAKDGQWAFVNFVFIGIDDLM